MSMGAPLAGPHAHSRASVSRTMLLVMVALAPATAFGLYTFGWPAIFLFTVTLLAALASEACCLYIACRPMRAVFDGSAALCGWIVALSLPPWAPWWIGVFASAVAIIVGKHVYGGLGQNLFNPAMVGRVAVLISFPAQMTSWTMPAPLGAPQSPGFDEALAITFGSAPTVDAVAAASALGYMQTELGRGATMATIAPQTYDPMTLAIGTVPGSLGETSALLLLLGGLLLLATRVITWRIPAAVLGSVALLATVAHLADPTHYPPPAFHLASGALLLGAFFIATDYVTSPVTPRGQLLYGAGIGVLIFVIRSWTAFPEGVAFAVLLMNAATPAIDHYVRPRIFGRTRGGKPLAMPKAGRQS
jgi:electron transport complex protein RnfD